MLWSEDLEDLPNGKRTIREGILRTDIPAAQSRPPALNEGKKIIVTIDKEVLERHHPFCKLTHFEGTADELAARTQFAIAAGQHWPLPQENLFVVEVDPKGFYSKVGAKRTPRGWDKPAAQMALVLVLRSGDHFRIFDIQAMVQHKHLQRCAAA